MMRAGMIASLIVTCGIAAGCQCHHRHGNADGHGPPVPVSNGGSVAGDVGADVFSSAPLLKDVPVTTVSGQSKLVTIAQGNVNFSVILGGCDENVVNAGTGEGMVVTHSDPSWDAEAGYALGWGWRPFIRTTQVITGSDGTTVLVQIVNKDLDTETHRVFLLRGGPTDVQALPGTSSRCTPALEHVILTRPMTFVESTITHFDDGVCYELSTIKSLNSPANLPLRLFVRSVLEARKAQTLVSQ